MESIPITAEEVEEKRPHAISLHDIQTPGPVQGFVRLLQVQEDRVKDLLPHGRNLLYQFDLEVDGPRTMTRPEPMEGVMVCGGGGLESPPLPSKPPPRDLCRVILFPLLGLGPLPARLPPTRGIRLIRPSEPISRPSTTWAYPAPPLPLPLHQPLPPLLWR